MRRGFGVHDRHSPFRFNPASLFVGGAVQGVFYDPSDLTTLFQDDAGTTPVTAVGQSVGRILDKSGNGNHATMATLSSRPVYQQTAGGLSYLAFDGSNDSMSTASINFSGTDKVSIFAGLTRLSDATQILCELSATGAVGSFATVLGPNILPANRYSSSSRGTAAGTSGQVATINFPNAPDTLVLTALHNISGSTSNIRRNGVAGTGSSGTQGTGNFGNYPLFIGRRNNSTFPMNAYLFGLIVLGATATSWQIQVTEQWMAGKTGLQF